MLTMRIVGQIVSNAAEKSKITITYANVVATEVRTLLRKWVMAGLVVSCLMYPLRHRSRRLFGCKKLLSRRLKSL